MAKTQRKDNAEEQEKAPESRAQKRRREEKQRFRTLVREIDETPDELDEDFETFEPIRRKRR